LVKYLRRLGGDYRAVIEASGGYDEMIRIQAELDRIARPFGGKSDGWGAIF
jgi:hypothetical protein